MWSNVSWGQWRTDLHQRAAAPLSGLQLAAGRSWSAAALVVTFNVRHGAGLAHGAQFGEPGGNVGALGAGGPVRFTAVTAGAAVVPVVTTDRLRNSKRNAQKTITMWLSLLVLNNHLRLAEGSSPISGPFPWSSRSYLWGSWFGRRTCSWPAELDRKQPDWAPSAGPGSSAAKTGWDHRALHKSVQPRYICSLLGSSARDRYSTQPGKIEMERRFNISPNPCKCPIQFNRRMKSQRMPCGTEIFLLIWFYPSVMSLMSLKHNVWWSYKVFSSLKFSFKRFFFWCFPKRSSTRRHKSVRGDFMTLKVLCPSVLINLCLRNHQAVS